MWKHHQGYWSLILARRINTNRPPDSRLMRYTGSSGPHHRQHHSGICISLFPDCTNARSSGQARRIWTIILGADRCACIYIYIKLLGDKAVLVSSLQLGPFHLSTDCHQEWRCNLTLPCSWPAAASSAVISSQPASLRTGIVRKIKVYRRKIVKDWLSF
jgi:hypothetical protein